MWKWENEYKHLPPADLDWGRIMPPKKRKSKNDAGVVPGLSYTAEWWIALVVLMLITGSGVIMAADPLSFGLDPISYRWMGVFVAMMGVFASVLPRITEKPTTDGAPRRRRTDE
jgi:hypothetical protein